MARSERGTMTFTYTEEEFVIVKTDEQGRSWFIPKDEGNSDYQRYLRWVENPDAEEGGTL